MDPGGQHHDGDEQLLQPTQHGTAQYSNDWFDRRAYARPVTCLSGDQAIIICSTPLSLFQKSSPPRSNEHAILPPPSPSLDNFTNAVLVRNSLPIPSLRPIPFHSIPSCPVPSSLALTFMSATQIPVFIHPPRPSPSSARCWSRCLQPSPPPPSS